MEIHTMTMLTVKCLTHKETFKVETINLQYQIMNLKKKNTFQDCSQKLISYGDMVFQQPHLN